MLYYYYKMIFSSILIFFAIYCDKMDKISIEILLTIAFVGCSIGQLHPLSCNNDVNNATIYVGIVDVRTQWHHVRF